MEVTGQLHALAALHPRKVDHKEKYKENAKCSLTILYFITNYLST